MKLIVYFKPVSYEKTKIVQFGEDDFGLYVIRGRRNHFGTGLAARGKFSDIMGLRRYCLGAK